MFPDFWIEDVALGCAGAGLLFAAVGTWVTRNMLIRRRESARESNRQWVKVIEKARQEADTTQREADTEHCDEKTASEPDPEQDLVAQE